MSHKTIFRFSGIAALSLLFLTTACTDTKTVFVEVPLFDDAPDGSGGFLGYTDSESTQPVCGNCHVGQNSEWQETAHSGAWETLQASGGAQGFCENCHTVGANGNFVTEANVGFQSTADTRYLDVQCESCHGPGLDHVTNPDASQPLASLLVGVELTSGCGECHQGNHHGFVDEWAQSRHGNMNSFPQTNASCVQCHEARGILEAWGVDAEYLEKDQTEPIPITCAVCHDPHDATNEHQLRFPISTPNVDINLCMKCHQRRPEPDPGSSRGPHSPQGPLLLGEAGWRPPDFVSPTSEIVATHGSEANPELCATCHVNAFTVTDLETGDFIFNATGHLFKAIPCLDIDGVPTTGDCELEERTFAACSSGSCHGSPAAARSALLIVRLRMSVLLTELNSLLDLVPATEFVTGDDLITTAEGARFNASMGSMGGSPIHNPFLMEALLTASILQVELDYGLPPVSSVTLDNILGSDN